MSPQHRIEARPMRNTPVSTRPVTLTKGKIYLLRGGHVMRYFGLYGDVGPCLAFRDPRDLDWDLPTGASFAPGDVLREVTREDRLWLQSRQEQATARKLTECADATAFVLAEVLGAS